MLTPSLKPDFDDTLQRFVKWWNLEETDRPVLELPVRPGPFEVAARRPETLRERWMDPQWRVEAALADLQSRPYVAETLPVFMPDVGPDLTATLLGADLEFGENTSWSHHPVRDVEEWQAVLERKPDFKNPYWQAIEKMTTLALERAGGEFLVGLPDLHGAYDMMVGLRGPEDLCIDLMEEPELVEKTALHMADIFNQAVMRAWTPLQAAGMPATTWTHFLHDGLAYVSSCDFWCLVSPEMARRHVVATIEREAAPLERSIFHLDGPDALRHLDWLLQCDRIQAIQWVYGAGKGPATRWLDVYRKCLEAGKAIQVLAETPQDLLALARELGSSGVWITLTRDLASVEQAEDLLRSVEAGRLSVPVYR
ncbi:MAG: hypothetical protein ACP5I4_00745 [Oceanipulchritudo sp.]